LPSVVEIEGSIAWIKVFIFGNAKAVHLGFEHSSVGVILSPKKTMAEQDWPTPSSDMGIRGPDEFFQEVCSLLC